MIDDSHRETGRQGAIPGADGLAGQTGIALQIPMGMAVTVEIAEDTEGTTAAGEIVAADIIE